MEKTVGQLLDAKGTQVWCTTPQATVYEALTVLAEKNVGALVVLDRDRVCGLFSERDYARNIALCGRDSRRTFIAEVMTEEPWTVARSQTVSDCMALMTQHYVRHLPVVDEQRLVGIVSIGDVVKATIETQAFLINQLERYITT